VGDRSAGQLDQSRSDRGEGALIVSGLLAVVVGRLE
jgi:hypothetical protein